MMNFAFKAFKNDDCFINGDEFSFKMMNFAFKWPISASVTRILLQYRALQRIHVCIETLNCSLKMDCVLKNDEVFTITAQAGRCSPLRLAGPDLPHH